MTVHILHDNTLTDDNRDKFNYIAGQYNQTVKFYNVEELCKERLEEFRKKFPSVVRNRWSIGSYYPLLVPSVVSKDVKKIIYLDADIIVNLDIATLWQTDLEGKTLAVIPNVLSRSKIYPLVNEGFVKHEDYFNSGVYIMNVEKFTAQNSILDEGIKFLTEHKYLYDDERVLNYCFSADTVKLPVKFNFQVVFERPRSQNICDKIIHYAARTLTMNTNDVYNDLFFQYFMNTPFHTAQTFGNINTGIQKVYNDQKDIMLRMINAVSGKKRLFYVTSDLEQKTRDLFQVKDDETVIVVDWNNPAELFRLTMSLGTDRGKIIHIFVAGGFVAKAKQHLLKQGFKEWQDFIDGGIAFGGNVNTNFIVNGM